MMLERDSRVTTCNCPRRNRDPIDPLIKHSYAGQSLIPPLDRRENRQDRYTRLSRLFDDSPDWFFIGYCFEISIPEFVIKQWKSELHRAHGKISFYYQEK